MPTGYNERQGESVHDWDSTFRFYFYFIIYFTFTVIYEEIKMYAYDKETVIRILMAYYILLLHFSN